MPALGTCGGISSKPGLAFVRQVVLILHMGTQQNQIGNRRSDSWWEPSFDPNLANPLPECDWTFTNSTGAQGSFLPADTACALAPVGGVLKFTRITFEKCNLQGSFEHKPSMLFDACRFYDCDFAFSTWKFATFRDCEFVRCSLSLSSFYDCEFRDCKWEDVGFSGSKTDFDRTFVTNPAYLINAGFSGVDPTRTSDVKHKRYQRFRLEGTKAHLARTLLYSHERVGDDTTFYDTARVHDIQQNRAKLYKSLYKLRHGSRWYHRLLFIILPAIAVERALLELMGLVNGWGAYLFRPLLGLIITTILFGLVYKYIPFGEVIAQPWQRAFDISNIAGYGSQVSNEQPLILRQVEAIHLILAILFYTLFFSTAVARNSRAR